MNAMQQVTVAHVALCDWSRRLTIAILESEGVMLYEFRSYTWENGEWFPFAFGLAGEQTCDDNDYQREVRNVNGLEVRSRLSAYAQDVLAELQAATPANPGDVQGDDASYLRERWGILTEAAFDLGVRVPPEVEWLVAHEEVA